MRMTSLKNNFFSTIVITFCFVLGGCDKPTECKTSHWPDPDVTISWQECNDVKTLKEYFDCHDSAIYQAFHDSKDIQVRGYIKKYVDSSRYIYNGLAICSDSFMTPDNFILLDYLDGIPASTYDSTCMSKLTGKIGPAFQVADCCGSKLTILIQKIEKL